MSRQVASHFAWSWVSTGAFYRGLAFYAKFKGVPIESEADLVGAIKGDQWKVALGAEKTLFICEGEDLTEEIYSSEVGQLASQISQFPEVRKELLAAQRACADGVTGLVAEGRDCGTVVFPDAELKFYLTASGSDRAHRRALQEGASVEKIEESQKIRDEQDKNRKAAPMQIPENAVVIDTSDLSLQEVVELVNNKVQSHFNL